ncbi:MAG: hypothetical protein IPJ65_01925 [Archangiaceae bacterium]|nr:hypothetical protein [Archangiaceae bacterium]
MLAEDESYRVRLEGRAELLEKTLLRYRALKDMLGSLTWRRRLRRNEPLLQEIISSQPRVDEALGTVEKKAAREGWLTGSQTLACAREVDDLKNAVWRQMGRKLKGTAGATFSERLTQLERLAVAGPRVVYPGERWKAALEALPGWLPELQQLHAFGELLEALFKRPYVASQRLPYTSSELTRLAALWADGDSALASCWARVTTVDTTGGVQRMLRRRARRAPMKPPKSGPELLLRAEFWRSLAVLKLRDICAEQVNPIQLAEAEVLSVTRWLVDRERDRAARLSGLSEARAALIELSAELWLATRSRGDDPGFWERLHGQAERADQSLASDADFNRLRDNVRMFLTVATGRPSRRPLERPRPQRPVPETLAGMVSELRLRLLERTA